MKTTKQMATVISKIAQEAGVDLTVCKPIVGSHVKVENSPYMALCIEVIDESQVSVAHYYEQQGDSGDGSDGDKNELGAGVVGVSQEGFYRSGVSECNIGVDRRDYATEALGDDVRI